MIYFLLSHCLKYVILPMTNFLYSSNKELEIVFRNPESDLNNILAWININSLKANPGKFEFMVLGTKEDHSFVLNKGKNKNERSTEVTLLGVKTDKQLKFKSHVEELCRKAAYINDMLCVGLESI